MKTPEEMADECEGLKTIIYDHDETNLLTPAQWISVKDRLPEKDQDVLWYNPTLLKPMDVDSISPLWNGSLEHNTYTHWMPLPKPPEDE